MTPQCGVAICRLALLSLPYSPSLPFHVVPSCFDFSTVFMRRTSESVPRFPKEGRDAPTRGTYYRWRARRGRKRSREERLTRRDQRRDSCLRRVSLRGQEGPRKEKKQERNILAGRDICGGGIHGFARNKGIRSKKIKAADGSSFFFHYPLFSLSFASLLTPLPCQDIDVSCLFRLLYCCLLRFPNRSILIEKHEDNIRKTRNSQFALSCPIFSKERRRKRLENMREI